jgi:tetratricopeptide (TPR) repeat protein
MILRRSDYPVQPMKIQCSPTRVLIVAVLILATGAGPFAQVTAAEKTAGDISRLLAQGRLEVRQRKYDQVIQTFSGALQMNPDPKTAAEIYGERGGVYADKGELDKAMADGEAAVRVAPNYFRGYQVCGRVHRRRKEFDRALVDFDKAMKLAPDFVQLYINRGNVFSDMGREERAIQDYSEAIRRAPGSIDGYVNRGGSYVVLQQFDKAIADLDHALRINPRDGDSYYNRALAHAGKRNYAAAIADYTTANEFSPHDPATLNSIAWLRATCSIDSVRNGQEAVRASLEACQLTNFKDLNRIDTLAAAYAEAGDFERAIEYMTKILGEKIDSTDRKKYEARLALYRNRKPYRDPGRVRPLPRQR